MMMMRLTTNLHSSLTLTDLVAMVPHRGSADDELRFHTPVQLGFMSWGPDYVNNAVEQLGVPPMRLIKFN